MSCYIWRLPKEHLITRVSQLPGNKKSQWRLLLRSSSMFTLPSLIYKYVSCIPRLWMSFCQLVSFFTVVVHCLMRMRLSHLSRVLLLHTLIVQPYPSTPNPPPVSFFSLYSAGSDCWKAGDYGWTHRTKFENTPSLYLQMAPAAHGHVVLSTMVWTSFVLL